MMGGATNLNPQRHGASLPLPYVRRCHRAGGPLDCARTPLVVGVAISPSPPTVEESAGGPFLFLVADHGARVDRGSPRGAGSVPVEVQLCAGTGGLLSLDPDRLTARPRLFWGVGE